MYSIVSSADGPIKCRYNSERYLALEMKNLSLAEGYPVQPCSMAAKRKRAAPGGLKSRWIRSAKRYRQQPASLLPALCRSSANTHSTHLASDFPPHCGSRQSKAAPAAIQKPARRMRMVSELKPNGQLIPALMKD